MNQPLVVQESTMFEKIGRLVIEVDALHARNAELELELAGRLEAQSAELNGQPEEPAPA